MSVGSDPQLSIKPNQNQTIKPQQIAVTPETLVLGVVVQPSKLPCVVLGVHKIDSWCVVKVKTCTTVQFNLPSTDLML